MKYKQRKHYEDPITEKWLNKKYPPKSQKYSAWQRAVNKAQMEKEIRQESKSYA
jgi:hypothetical protein